MSTKRVSLNGLTGVLLALIAVGAFIWTFSSPLRSMELFIPRVSFGLIVLGGVLVFIKDVWNPEVTEHLNRELILPYAIGVSLAMWAYGWAFRNVGLMTATVVFLSLWWIWVAYRDTRRSGNRRHFWIIVAKRVALAVVIAVVIQLLFVTLLRMHLPRTPLP